MILPGLDTSVPFALFDDCACPSDQACSLLLWDLEETLVCDTPAVLDRVLAQAETAAASGRYVAFVVEYELGYWLEPGLFKDVPRSAEPPLQALIFRCGLALNDLDTTAFISRHVMSLPAEKRPSGVAGLSPGIAEADYLAAVERILAYIRSGDCYQVNFTFPLRFEHYGDPLSLYGKLRTAQPVHYGAFLRLPGRDILSLSPELFVTRHGATLTTRPMKGTAARDTDPAVDALRCDELHASEKNRAENLMIVDLIRNDLGRIASLGTVAVRELFALEAYPTVWQMTSTVVAEAPDATLAAVFRALFPCGSVTGAPKLRAMQIAAELEPAQRGVYTGALGWLRPGGDFGFNVPIRTLSLARQGSGTLGIGSGIVADSMPADEYGECLLKARFLTGLAADFDLIETLLLMPDAGRPYPLIDDHIARLTASARYFGFKCDTVAVIADLLAHARQQKNSGARRVRLLLAKDGTLHIESFALEDAAMLPQRIVLAEQRIDSHDPLRRHKTTARQAFESEWSRRADASEIFDIVFCNERGELCEGSRSNLFLEFDGIWHTPPTAVGLLDGVMRRRLLQDSRVPIVERMLLPDDLLRASAIYACNAVRGTRRVRFDDAAPATCNPARLAA